MVTPHHREVTIRVRELSLLDVLYPRLVDADRVVVFRFAGDRARVTPNAFPVVDDEAVICNSDHLSWDALLVDIRNTF